jgi:ribosomal protein uL13
MKTIIDATGGSMGRIASYSAKQALLGKEVIVVNCNDALIIGDRKGIAEKYRILRRKGGSSMKGPKISKVPYMIMKRAVRGMLPHKKGRGAIALKKVICYNDVPAEYEKAEKVSFKRDLKIKAIKLSKLKEELG